MSQKITNVLIVPLFIPVQNCSVKKKKEKQKKEEKLRKIIRYHSIYHEYFN